MTPEETQNALRTASIMAATKNYIETLQSLGVPAHVIGFALNDDPDGQGMTNIGGSSTLILNLLASIIKGMRPADFKNLLSVMLAGDYFQEHREAIGLSKKPPADKTGLVN